MRVIISGPVTEAYLADADLLVGIVPTSYVTNGLSIPPFSSLITNVFPIDPMLPDIGERRINYVLAQNADALVLVGENDHLLNIAQQYHLAIFTAES